jgi:hypothetical protein
LIPGKTYQFKAIAVNAVGSSVPSSALTVIAAQEPLTPSAPTKVSGDETQITIGWTAPNSRGTPITGYEVWWNGGGSGSVFSKLADLGPNVLTLQQTPSSTGGLTPGEFYSFKVLAKNGVGSSLLSQATTIRAANVPDAPNVPVMVY